MLFSYIKLRTIPSIIRLSAVAVMLLFLSGCLGPRKIDKWVSKQYNGTIPAAPKRKSDYLTVKSNLAGSKYKISTTQKKTSNVLPLLFYWQWDYKNTCTLNPEISVNNFTSAIYRYANTKGLKQKLNGQTIELTVNKMPNTFAIDDKGHLIWFIYAFGWDFLSIQPQDNEMVVSYKLFQDNRETKNGVITVANSDKGIQLKMFQSLKKKTWQYLGQYDASITAMSKEVVDKLLLEL